MWKLDTKFQLNDTRCFFLIIQLQTDILVLSSTDENAHYLKNKIWNIQINKNLRK